MSETNQKVELAVCMGSSCFSRGNRRNIKVVQQFINRHGLCDKVLLKGHLCEGLCKDGPNITLDGEVFHSVDTASIALILDQHVKP